MKYYPIKTLIAMVLISLVISVFAVQAQTPQETLNQYISDLQQYPNNTALREKIIKLVYMMKTKPVLSDEAIKLAGKATYIFKNAKTESDFVDAAEAYKQALLAAPWKSDYYFNQGMAFEKANKPKEAIESFKLYLVASPNAQDKDDVLGRIGGLEYIVEKAAKKAIESLQKKSGLKALVGDWYEYAQNIPETCRPLRHYQFELQSEEIIVNMVWDMRWWNYIAGDKQYLTRLKPLSDRNFKALEAFNDLSFTATWLTVESNADFSEITIDRFQESTGVSGTHVTNRDKLLLVRKGQCHYFYDPNNPQNRLVR